MKTNPPASRPTEDGLIARYFAPLAGHGADGLRDDAATLAPSPGCDLVLTADAIVEGVHCLPDDPPASIARKVLGVNLSDIAAKGATPRGFLLTLALPDDWTEDWLAGFATGLSEAAMAFGCPLLGGDTVRSAGPALIGVTAIGEVSHGGMVRRMTAEIGDILCVSGTIGDAALGLRLLDGSMPKWGERLGSAARGVLIDRYRHPRPRISLARSLRRHARAAMDVSDGLAGDLTKMLAGGGRSAEIILSDVPLSDSAREALALDPGLIHTIVTGGDDYEILCAVPPNQVDAFIDESLAVGIPLTRIGTVVTGDRAPVFRRSDGSEHAFTTRSFSHF
ncbi:thiamine-phosphate kinase [Methylobacterium sp. Leaf93]|uniref:thiamine-phosphate kinase n=1 Tax=Methylobacterium sp. Leaf93 TaxID=1736249 RepID=UPI0006FCF69F|nr:thiamine-phosphate kinase [Methylobacterium sp. Leaf93]KQP05736.1 thiamine-monophosphate kinase [Methylobacterium sp. Leaf93]